MAEFIGIRNASQRPKGKWKQVGGKYKRDDDAVRAAKNIANKEDVDTYVSAETYGDTSFVYKKISEGVKMKKSELKALIKECVFELTEAKISPEHKNEFVRWAKEIILNVEKDYPKLKATKHWAINVTNIIEAMPKDNVNHNKIKKYLPKKYDVTLVTNGDKNSHESPWWSMSDNQRFTIVKMALKSLGK
jgi:hypothetical protein